MNLQIIKIADLDAKAREKVDEFILDDLSNGEFIGTLDYLSYHPSGRFIDDSIIVQEPNSGNIKSVVMAASIQDKNTIISHPGTTFSGPIFKSNQGVDEINEVLNLLLEYYENKYSEIEFRIQPTSYSSQPLEDLTYLLNKKGYNFGYTALANVIHLTDIKKEEDILRLYGTSRRNQVRKLIRASNYDFQKKDNIDEKIWENINNNLESRYDTSPTHSFSDITNLQNKFPNHIIPYTTYRNDGEYGASAVVFKFKNVFHTQYLDVNYHLRKDYPNVFLIHNLIKTAIAEGFTMFSFGSSTENGGEAINQGLYNFKKYFGGGRILLPLFKKRTED